MWLLLRNKFDKPGLQEQKEENWHCVVQQTAFKLRFEKLMKNLQFDELHYKFKDFVKP